MMDYFIILQYECNQKREGFQGQRAIVIPAKILARHFDNHPVVKQLYITDIGYYPNALYHHQAKESWHKSKYPDLLCERKWLG